MIDRAARQALIDGIGRVLDGDEPVRAAMDFAADTEDRAVLEIQAGILDDLARLPLSPEDDLTKPSPQGREQMARALLLLRTDLAYEPTPKGHLTRLMVLLMVIYVTGALTDMIAQDRLVPAVANPVRLITAISGAMFALPLVLVYVAALFHAGIHIFRVRVQRRTVSDLDPRNIWPFASPSQLNQARSLTLTGASPA